MEHDPEIVKALGHDPELLAIIELIVSLRRELPPEYNHSPGSRPATHPLWRRRMKSAHLLPAALNVRLHDPSLLPELTRHFERSGFRVQQLGDVLNVERPDAPDQEQGTREVLVHLSVWQAMYPDSVISPS